MDVGEEFGIYFKIGGWGVWCRNEEGNIILFSTIGLIDLKTLMSGY